VRSGRSGEATGALFPTISESNFHFAFTGDNYSPGGDGMNDTGSFFVGPGVHSVP
jgi:hypothetical protein